MKGKKEFERFKAGETLTHKQAILAQCYICNGLNEGGHDCKGIACPLYQHMPYRQGRRKRQLSEAEREQLTKRLRSARKTAKETFTLQKSCE